MNTVTTTSYSLNANVASFNTTISSPLMQKLHKNKVLSSVLAIETNGGGQTGKTYTAALPMHYYFASALLLETAMLTLHDLYKSTTYHRSWDPQPGARVILRE